MKYEGWNGTPQERFARFCSAPDERGCLIWQGMLDAKGYGAFRAHGRTMKAHRFSYQQWRGDLLAGMEIDHLCRNRACVNPEHLEQVTHAENMRRAANLATHCPQGHAFDEVNSYTNSKGHRECLACKRERQALYTKRRRALALG